MLSFGVEGVFLLVPVLRDASIEPGRIAWVNIGIENDVINVPNENRQDRQNRFIEVNGGSDINHPAREKLRYRKLEPDHESRDSHDDRTPNHRPVFHFLRVAKAAERGLGGSRF